MSMKRIVFTTLALVIMATFTGTTELLAAQSSFVVGVNVTNPIDAIAPSVPSNAVATALSSAKIKLSWDASTDNVGVTGYHIYRDLALVATTTALDYTDSGLTASTTYAYTVSAVDAAGNESAQSATATATTLAAPVTPPTPSGAGAGSSQQQVLLVTRAVTATAGSRAIVLSWSTNIPAASNVYWGKTADYELGGVSEVTAVANHSIRVSGLEPGTSYVFRIEMAAANGQRASVDGVRAATLAEADVEAPANVRNFEAKPDGAKIKLDWQNPADPDFQSVRIVKSDKFFPSDPFDGEVVFDGKGEEFSDANVKSGTTYYYAAFAEDSAGNYSSGAVASAATGAHAAVTNPLDNLPAAPNSESLDPMIAGLTIRDFTFIQNGAVIPPGADETIAVDGGKNLKISIAYGKVPEILKTIAVTLSLPDDPAKQFSFLLRINKDKSAYEAVIAPLAAGGTYGMTIAVIDYKNRGMKELNGALLVSAGATEQGGAPGAAMSEDALAELLVIKLTEAFALIVILIGLLVEAFLIWRREFEKKKILHAARVK